MILGEDLDLDLTPIFPARIGLSFDRLLHAAMEVEFDLAAYQKKIDEMLRTKELQERHLRSTVIRDDELLLSEELNYPTHEGWLLELTRTTDARAVNLEFDNEDAAVYGAVLRSAATSPSVEAFRAQMDGFDEEAMEMLLGSNLKPRPRWRPATTPGIYRREHASLLIRSETTSVLLDPFGWHPLAIAPRCPDGEVIDAIAISHTHGDHLHWPSSLISAASSETPLIVPVVPRANLLAPQDMLALGTSLGQKTIALPWYDTFTVGDIRIQALPFFGEQPTVDPPGPPEGLRSWGNCYRITTPQFSVMVMVDSGNDPMGRMEDVVRRSLAESGPVDVVTSCLREFLSPFFGGLSTYFASVPFARMRELNRQRLDKTLPYTTAGPTAVGELCHVAKAKYFLPYAHGFAGFANPITDVGWGQGEPTEKEMSARVARRIQECGGTTSIVEWVPGASAHFDNGAIRIAPPL